MAQQFYVKINNVVHGPLTGQRIQEMAQSGQLSPTDEVRLATSQSWFQAGNLKGLQFATPPTQDVSQQSPQSSPSEQEKEDLDLRVGIPNPPDYPAISFFIGFYNFLGGLTIFVGIIGCGYLNDKKQSDLIPPLIIFIVFGAAFCFFSAQLLSLAFDSARNLHRLTHANLLMMQSIVNNKK